MYGADSKAGDRLSSKQDQMPLLCSNLTSVMFDGRIFFHQIQISDKPDDSHQFSSRKFFAYPSEII